MIQKPIAVQSPEYSSTNALVTPQKHDLRAAILEPQIPVSVIRQTIHHK